MTGDLRPWEDVPLFELVPYASGERPCAGDLVISADGQRFVVLIVNADQLAIVPDALFPELRSATPAELRLVERAT